MDNHTIPTKRINLWGNHGVISFFKENEAFYRYVQLFTKFTGYPHRLFLPISLLVFFVIFSQAELKAQPGGTPFISDPVSPDTLTIDLSQLPVTVPWQPGDSVQVVPLGVHPDSAYDSPSKPFIEDRKKDIKPGLKRTSTVNPAFAAPAAGSVTNFQGIPATGKVPPDVVGDVGPNHYIQMVNTNFAIYDKAGTLLLVGPSPINSLWAGFGGPCETLNNGDPIVRYDQQADRWLMSQFAVPGGAAGFHECICISRTPDPVAGGWFLYDFTTPAFPDYPQIGVWPDGYYMSTYEGANLGVFAFDRTRMLSGLPASFIRFTLSSLSSISPRARTRILPSDLDGPLVPPAGSPNYFVRSVDGLAQGGGGDRLEVFEFHADFANPFLSTFTFAGNLPVMPYDIQMCGPGMPRNCIPQPGTSQGIDPLSNRLMRRLQYRNFGTQETLVANQTIDVNSQDIAGIRWYELRKTGAGWAVHQQGTHSRDNLNRWMGSIAMDGAGNIGLGYSVSSRTEYPGIRFTGRQSSDPPGVMAGETNLIIGGGSQTTFWARWGDYSSMNVDPVDDCTFWFTTEYYDATSAAGWRTLISKIQNPLCGKQPYKYMYSAKIICGTQKEPDNLRLARGIYATTINIHNPNETDVNFLKKLAFTYPPAKQSQGRIDTIGIDVLGPDGALKTDCIDIQQRLYPNGFPTPYMEGFVVVKSPEPLDVTAVYTSAKLPSFFSPQKVTSIDVEQIRERRLKAEPDPKECPDLVVQDIDMNSLKVDCPGGGGTCVTTVTFTIANIGAGDAGPFNIRIEADPGVIVNQFVAGGLAGGGTQTFTITTPPGGNCYDPDCTISVTVDSNNEVEECNEKNNRLSETTIG
jgi:CARDB